MQITQFQESIPIALVSFVVGVLVGFFGRAFVVKDRSYTEKTGNQFVLVVVTLVWASAVLYSFLNPVYQVSPLLHGLMGAIVGFFYRPFRKNGSDTQIPEGGPR